MATNYATWDPSSGLSQTDFLYQQIVEQQLAGLGNWSGGLDPRTSAQAMATDLAASGITSLGQIGWSDKAERPSWEGVAPGGRVGAWSRGGVGADNVGAYDFEGYAEDDPIQGRWTSGFINKDTGKLLKSNYGERTGGNTWSGSYAGPGNTGFDLNFDAQGRPIFGTHGASSIGGREMMGIPFLAGAGMFAAPFLSGALGSMSSLGEGVGTLLGGAGGDALGTAALGAEMFPEFSAAFAPELVGGGAAVAGADPLGQFIANLSAAPGMGEALPAGTLASSALGSSGASGWDSLLKSFGMLQPDGSMNWLAATKALSSLGSGIYGMNQANAMKQLANQSISGSSPWTASGGTAMAGDALKQTISGNLDKDPGFKLAQANAARASSQNPGGMAATAAANAALKFQNDRIQALGPAAGVGFSPAAGYQTGLGGVQAGNSLAGSSLASIGYGLTGQGNSAASMPPWLQAYLIQNGIGGTHV